jgi:nucleoid-associated protein EbfC
MPKMPNPFGGFNIQAMMQKVQKLAEDTENVEKELAGERIEATSGGGMVKAIVNGMAELVEVKISPEVVDPSDIEMLEDLVTSAVREGLEKAVERRKERMQELTGGLGIPPGTGIPGF